MKQNENHKQNTRVCVMKSVGLENKNPRQNIDMEAFEKNIRSTNIHFHFSIVRHFQILLQLFWNLAESIKPRVKLKNLC